VLDPQRPRAGGAMILCRSMRPAEAADRTSPSAGSSAPFGPSFSLVVKQRAGRALPRRARA
jgi:hypothetical protein